MPTKKDLEAMAVFIREAAFSFCPFSLKSAPCASKLQAFALSLSLCSRQCRSSGPEFARRKRQKEQRKKIAKRFCDNGVCKVALLLCIFCAKICWCSKVVFYYAFFAGKPKKSNIELELISIWAEVSWQKGNFYCLITIKTLCFFLIHIPYGMDV